MLDNGTPIAAIRGHLGRPGSAAEDCCKGLLRNCLKPAGLPGSRRTVSGLAVDKLSRCLELRNSGAGSAVAGRFCGKPAAKGLLPDSDDRLADSPVRPRRSGKILGSSNRSDDTASCRLTCGRERETLRMEHEMRSTADHTMVRHARQDPNVLAAWSEQPMS